MKTRPRRRLGLLAAGLGPLVVVAAAGPVAGGQANSRGPFRVVAELHDAGAILDGSDVKAAGVKVGSVTGLEVHGHLARVTLRLDRRVYPLHRDARITVRPVSLLGERFMDLDPGSPESPILPAGAVIPASQTGRSVDLDEVLSTIDNPTGVALATLLTTLGEGLGGRGADAGAALAALGPALTDTSALLDLLNDQNAMLTGVVDRLAPVTGALGNDRAGRLDHLVGSANELLGSTTASRRQLGAALERLPSTLTAAQGALAQLGGLAGEATPVLGSLRPLTANLSAAAGELERFAGAAGPAVGALGPVLDRARELFGAARPAVTDLAAAGGDLEAVARSSRPLVERLDDNLGSILDFVRNWALVTNGYDGVSHYLRAHVITSPVALAGVVPAPTPALPGFGRAGQPPEAPRPFLAAPQWPALPPPAPDPPAPVRLAAPTPGPSPA